ncbi:MAG TPA: glycerophosphodiester phosphodiesterase [Kofleriaceae bacterium]|nr:glycerophosphodiester phosphodiesterase [Kofleriaceae bacterium]
MHPRRLYAHRGASAERPENTIPAFQRALELGVDALELDVHLTRDKVLIVSHDETAQRMTGAPLAWRDLDLVDAQRLDAGWGFVAKDGTRPFAGQGINVPTFETILREFPGVHLNVDLKGDDSVQAVLAMLRKHDAEDRVTLASFSTPTLVSVRRAGFPGETALAQAEVAALFTVPAVIWRQLPFTGSAAQVPTNAGPLRFDRAAFIAKCHAVGLRVDFWTIDDVTDATRLLELGADGIMTNDPASLKGLFI